MTIVQAAALGVLQGLTEFLPVSSSGHLALAGYLFALKDMPVLFDTFLHIGTLCAVCVVLRKEILILLRHPIQKMMLLLIISTFITAIFAFVFKKNIGSSGETILANAFASPRFLGIAFFITSASLFFAELFSRGKIFRGKDQLNIVDAFCIGIAQGFGILPGISRSGITLAASLGRLIEREEAARYSFLLSIPAILGALVLQIKDIPGIISEEGIGAPAILIGTVTSAVVGFFSIRFMLALVKSRPLYGFAIYTAILGIIAFAIS